MQMRIEKQDKEEPSPKPTGCLSKSSWDGSRTANVWRERWSHDHSRLRDGDNVTGKVTKAGSAMSKFAVW